MQRALILLVEGRGAAANSLGPALERKGYEVDVVHTGTAALRQIEDNRPALVVFDASSMRSSGVRTCRRIRTALIDAPIIHARPAGAVEDRRAGADMYLARPFTPRKLLNRVKVLLPADDQKEEIVRFGPLTFFRSKRSVELKGQGERRLTPKLARLLEEFIRYPNQVVTRKQLMVNVWNTEYVGDTRTLDVHIRWIRESIEENPAKPTLLLTVRGQGYILSIP